MNLPDKNTLGPSNSPPVPESGGAAPQRPMSIWEVIDNPWVVLILLFFVMAILGLPVLWKSRGFSTLSKIILSVVVTLYTAFIFWLFWLIMVWCYNRVVNSFV